MGKAAAKAPIAAVENAAHTGSATHAKPAAQPAKAPAAAGSAPRTRDAGQPRDTTANSWRDLHPTRIWPD